MSNSYSLTSDCYVIPYEEKGPLAFLAYFPLQSLVFEINEDAAEILQSIKRVPFKTSDPEVQSFLENLVSLKVVNSTKEEQPHIKLQEKHLPTHTILLLSESCNLKCLYCYNNAQKTGEMMSLDLAKDAIDTVIGNAMHLKAERIDLGFHGIGEPTLNWSVLTESIYYARERCKSEKIGLCTSICTNGIMPKEKILWLIDNIQNITVSIDGSPEIQNKQRPFLNGEGSFDKAAETIDILNEHKKSYACRLTATEFSEGRLREVVRFMIERFNPPIVCIEPLFVCGRCETSGCRPPLDESFINEMKEVYELGKKSNTSIQYSGNRISFLMSRFCGAQGSNFFVTPRGDVTACLEICQRDDPRADFFIYGKHDPETKQFVFDYKKFERLTSNQVQSFESCRDCFAKWHCCGDCLSKTPDFSKLSEFRNPYRCKVNKALIKDTLIKTMNQHIDFSNSNIKVTVNS